jgi:hypothetical protein
VSGLRGVWRTLGLAATTETAAIRSAYATRLKAMDPDTDPEAFRRLREARDHALALARSGQIDDDGDFDEDFDDTDTEYETATEIVAGNTELLAADPLDDSEPAVAGPPQYDPIQAILDILRPGEEREPLAADEEADLQHHFAALTADPRLQEVDFFARVEPWFAGLIADTLPRSHPLIPSAVAFFGWSDQSGSIHTNPAVDIVVQRHHDLAFVAAVENPRHALHDAWQELNRPTDSSTRIRFSFKRRAVRTLLERIRREHPSVEGVLDWHRIALWDEKLQPGGGRTGGISHATMIWIFLVIVVNIGRIVWETPSAPIIPPPSTTERSPEAPGLPWGGIAPDAGAPSSEGLASDETLATQTRDIDQLLDTFVTTGSDDGLNLAKLDRANPKLATMLRSNWQIAKDEGRSQTAFVRGMHEVLSNLYSAGVLTAGYDTVAEYRRIQAGKARALQKHSPELCDALFEHGSRPAPALVPVSLLKREAALQRTAMLSIPTLLERPTTTPQTFLISGKVVAAAAKRAGLTPDRFGAAMRSGGTAAERCRAHTALIDVALELPRGEGLVLLRKM